MDGENKKGTLCDFVQPSQKYTKTQMSFMNDAYEVIEILNILSRIFSNFVNDIGIMI